MTHLRIEQNNILENVSSAVIEKLYLLATSGDLDLSSNLAGNLHTTGTYLEYIDALCKTLLNPNGMFPDLTISYNKLYYKFNDPVFQLVCALNWGDGVGITLSEFANITDTNNWIPTQILNNSDIKDLSELQYFTNIKGNDEGNNFLWKTKFDNMTSLEKIIFPNTLIAIDGRYDNYIFKNLQNLKYVDFNGIKRVIYAFGGNMPNLETLIFGEGCEEIGSCMVSLSADTKITSISFPSTVKIIQGISRTLITSITISGNVLEFGSAGNNPNLQNVIFEDSNVPLLISGGSYSNSGTFEYCPLITTLIFPNRPITFNANSSGFISNMQGLTTLVFKAKPVSVDWSKFAILHVPGYGSQKLNNVTDIYFPDADYNDMVADFLAANSNYTLATFHKLSDYPGLLNQS